MKLFFQGGSGEPSPNLILIKGHGDGEARQLIRGWENKNPRVRVGITGVKYDDDDGYYNVI